MPRAAVGPRLGLAQRVVAVGGDGSVVARIDRGAHARSLGSSTLSAAGPPRPSSPSGSMRPITPTPQRMTLPESG